MPRLRGDLPMSPVSKTSNCTPIYAPAVDDDSACWHLYVLRTGQDTLYTGITLDVERRFAEHAANGARTARYLRSRGPLTLIYHARIGDKSLALRAEHVFKRLTRARKLRVIAGLPSDGKLLEILGLR